MTKHILVCRHTGEEFQEEINIAESRGWQALPQTFSHGRATGFILLMFRIESNDVYRTETTS